MTTPTFKGWRKASRSTGNPSNCVEVGETTGLRAVRDSKNPDGPMLIFTEAQFDSFLHRVRGNTE